MTTIVGILTFLSRKNSILGLSEPKISQISWYFYTYEHLKSMLNWVEHEKSSLEPGLITWMGLTTGVDTDLSLEVCGYTGMFFLNLIFNFLCAFLAKKPQMGSSLKEINLPIEEQILSLKSWSLFRRNAKMKLSSSFYELTPVEKEFKNEKVIVVSLESAPLLTLLWQCLDRMNRQL